MSQISDLAFIGEGVTLGKNVTIGPFAVLLGPCTVEDNVWIGSGAHIGAPPEISSLTQNAAWSGQLDHAGVTIERGAVLREGVVIHQGSYRATTLGAESWVLNRAYVAHDVIIGRETTISAGVSIGGHCRIGDFVNIGMNASVHQRRIIAPGAMIGMGSPVTADVPPFAKAFGSPARLAGINAVGMERAGISAPAINRLRAVYGNEVTELSADDPELAELATHLEWWHEAQPVKPLKSRKH